MRLVRWASSLALAILCGTGETTVRAQTAATPNDRAFDTTRDTALTLSLASFVAVIEVAKSEIAPEGCRWCTKNVVDEAVRTGLHMPKYRTELNDISSVAAFGLLPGFGIGALVVAANTSGRRDHGAENVLMVAQPAIFATALSEVAKYLAARQRPLVRDPAEDARLESAEHNLSFFSGHSALAFSLASGMGTVASMRGYASEPLFWSVGMGLAAFVGYLRIAADKHYFTDVLVGALVGTVSGIVVPRLLHPSAETTRVAAAAFGRSEAPGAPQPLQLSYSGHF